MEGGGREGEEGGREGKVYMHVKMAVETLGEGGGVGGWVKSR